MNPERWQLHNAIARVELERARARRRNEQATQ